MIKKNFKKQVIKQNYSYSKLEENPPLIIKCFTKMGLENVL